ILAAFIVGSFAITTTNGGIGVYPIAMGAVLLLFGINQQAGEAFGWIVWGSQTVLVLVLGGLSLILLPILNQKKSAAKPNAAWNSCFLIPLPHFRKVVYIATGFKTNRI